MIAGDGSIFPVRSFFNIYKQAMMTSLKCYTPDAYKYHIDLLFDIFYLYRIMRSFFISYRIHNQDDIIGEYKENH